MDHKTENQLSYGWMKGFSTVQLEKISPELNNYGTVTNKTFFGEYKGDYNLLRKGKSGTSLEGEEILKYPTIDKVKNE